MYDIAVFSKDGSMLVIFAFKLADRMANLNVSMEVSARTVNYWNEQHK